MAACPCRTHPHPRPLDIPAGLSRLPRAVGSFGEFRRAMLSDASRRSPLATWSAREPGDLGVLLVEMWALACAVVAFADETICHECYARTARREESLHGLVSLLGYRPRPAVAATAEVSVRVAGRSAVLVPAGTAIRSGAVGDGPPQVFESLADTVAHPLANGFDVVPGVQEVLGETVPGSGVASLTALTAVVSATGLTDGALLRVHAPTGTRWARVAAATAVTGPGARRLHVALATPVEMAAATVRADVELQVAGFRTGLWTLDVTGYSQTGVSAATDGTTDLTLEGRDRRFSPGDVVVVERGGAPRWFSVTAVTDLGYHVTPEVTYSTGDGDATLPGAVSSVTRLRLDAALDDPTRRVAADDTDSWDDDEAAELAVLGGWRRVAGLEPVPATELPSTTTLPLGPGLDRPVPDHAPHRFAVVDRDGRGVTSDGALSWQAEQVVLDEAAWEPPLRHPVRVDGNVVTVTRGESVTGEVLGSGDAAVAGQVFTLAKAPLTHLGPAAAGGTEVAVSTLVVHVDGIRWREVPHLVGAGPTDRVYVTRNTPDGATEVVFGDGVRGARLPSGEGNVVADYRWGAGAAAPGPGSLTALVEPVPGVLGVVNRAPATGGADAESPAELRTSAARSALLLGRIVSPADAVAAARQTPGVLAASAEFAWRPARLQAGLLVRYIGDTGLVEGLRARLRALAERDAHLDVVASPAQPVAVTLILTVDARHRLADVEAAAREALVGEAGALRPEVLGVDGPLFRSRLLAAVLATAGVAAVTGVVVDGAVMGPSMWPAAGAHLDGTHGLQLVTSVATATAGASAVGAGTAVADGGSGG